MKSTPQLNGYEQTRRSQILEIGAPSSSQPPLSPHNADEENTNDTDSEDGDQGEPSLFKILQNDAKDELQDDT